MYIYGRSAFVLVLFAILSSLHKSRKLNFLISKRVRLFARVLVALVLAFIAAFADLPVVSMMGVVTAVVFSVVIFEEIGGYVVGGIPDDDKENEERNSTSNMYA